MDEVIGQILSTQGEDSNGEKSVTETMQGVESLDSDEEDTKKKKKTEVQSQGADAEDFVNKHKDDIDAVLNQ
jgi:hypothetical protein